MGLSLFVFGTAIILIVVLVLVVVVSPDNWGRCCTNCNQSCCQSCATSSGSGSCDWTSSSGIGTQSTTTTLQTTRGVQDIVMINKEGDIENSKIIQGNAKQRIHNLRNAPDPYSIVPSTSSLWKLYQTETQKRVALKSKTYIVTADKIKTKAKTLWNRSF